MDSSTIIKYLDRIIENGEEMLLPENLPLEVSEPILQEKMTETVNQVLILAVILLLHHDRLSSVIGMLRNKKLLQQSFFIEEIFAFLNFKQTEQESKRIEHCINTYCFFVAMESLAKLGLLESYKKPTVASIFDEKTFSFKFSEKGIKEAEGNPYIFPH